MATCWCRLLFSEAVNLHPVAIICAVLLFGGLWGFWGVFFAIPLATLFKAVLDAWPRKEPVVAPLLVTALIFSQVKGPSRASSLTGLMNHFNVGASLPRRRQTGAMNQALFSA